MFVSAAGVSYFEGDWAYYDSLWWSIVTLTTVGYGDISPSSLGGRLIGITIMLLGIGILGMLTASIASIFVERKMKEERGMSSFDFNEHIIICEWNSRARAILAELRRDVRSAEKPVILIANLDIKPVEDDDLFFIKGRVNEENLQRAHLQKAATVIILGNDNLDEDASDAQAVLAALTVESINRAAYSIVELFNESNVRHCQRAGTDEIIIGSEFSSKLITRAALDHGITKVMSEILSSNFGNDLVKVSLPEELVGKEFIEVMTEMKRQRQATVLGVQKNGDVISNPPSDLITEAGDDLIVIAPQRPT